MTIYLIIEKIFIINSLRFKQLHCNSNRSFDKLQCFQYDKAFLTFEYFGYTLAAAAAGSGTETERTCKNYNKVA